MSRRRSWVLFPFYLAALPACLGTSTGNPAEDPGGSPSSPGGPEGVDSFGNPGCDEETEALDDLDAATDAGFAPADVLGFAEASFTTSLAWSDGPWTPASGQVELEIGVHHAGGEARYVRRSPHEPGADEQVIDIAVATPYCPDRVDVDVELTLRSSDGALDETLPATLRASTPHAATIVSGLALDELGGSFAWNLTDPEGVTAQYLRLFVQVSALGVRGGIDGVVERATPATTNDASNATRPPGAGPDGGVVARFPADDPCPIVGVPGELGFAVTPEMRVGSFSPQDAVDILGGTDVAVAWPDIGESTLTLSFTPSYGCVHFDALPPYVDVRGAAGVTSEDGRLDVRFDGTLIVETSPALDPTRLRVFNTTSLSDAKLSIEALAAAVADLDLTGYQEGALMFQLEVQLGDGWRLAEGSIDVYGVRACMAPEPPTDPAPTPGAGTSQSGPSCGFDHVVLLSAPLGSFEDESAACEVHLQCYAGAPGLDQASCVANIGSACAACMMPLSGSADVCGEVDASCLSECRWLAPAPTDAAGCNALLEYGGNDDPHGACLCEGCSDAMGACLADRGCGEILRCAQATGCVGTACQTSCGDAIARAGGESAWLANELGLCSAGAGCL